mgnify:CR=1 FL=1
MRMENNPMEVLTETYSEEEQRNYAGGASNGAIPKGSTAAIKCAL